MADLNHQSTSQYQKLDHFKETFANCLWSLLIQAENQNILQWNKSEQNFHNDLMEDLLSSIEQPPEFSLGDYAFVPFKVAKRLKENPQKITQYFSDELNKLILGQNTPWLKEVVTKGAFLNIFINTQHMSTFLIPAILDHSYFDFFQKNQTQALTTMIEFSQPNTHKDLHVGHGRNICLGDSICRLYQYIGEKVIPVNYFGDEGAHVAKSLYAIKKILGDKSIDDVIDHQNKSQWLNERYAEAHQLLTESEKNKDSSPEALAHYQTIQKDISQILKNLEAQSGEDFLLWKQTRQYSLDDFKSTYQWLDVHFEVDFFESEVSQESQKIVDEYLEKGLFKIDQGAVGFDMSDKKLGFFMARKSDGTTLYITKDLALARRKFEKYHVDRSVYVVASEQNFHFKQLFYALEKMGFEAAKNCFHLSYGMVVRPEGKMSSRLGNTFTFQQLRNLIEDEIATYLTKYQDEWPKELVQQTTHRLTVGAIKYGMLSTDPVKDIVFDPKEWVSFEGNSGPYLMYSYARTVSLIKKCHDHGHSIDDGMNHLHLIHHEAERELLRFLYDFNKTVLHSAKNYKPSSLASYLFQLCKSFNRFYIEVPILRTENKELRGARIALLTAFNKTLNVGLNLLGITPPDKM